MRNHVLRPSLALSLLSLVWIALLATLAPAASDAQQPTCVTRCEEKVDACASDCEALGDAVYRDPASLRQCQLACAQQLFVSCVERCSRTGEVVADDFGIVAPNPDQLPEAPAERR